MAERFEERVELYTPLQGTLRSTGMSTLDDGQVEQMLTDRGFFLYPNTNFSVTPNTIDVVYDAYTHLIWDKYGSATRDDIGGGHYNLVTLEAAQAYIDTLNQQCPHANWRLPTVEEAMSLAIEYPDESGELKICKPFRIIHPTQKFWTCDAADAPYCWYVDYNVGEARVDHSSNEFGVRAVRSA